MVNKLVWEVDFLDLGVQIYLPFNCVSDISIPSFMNEVLGESKEIYTFGRPWNKTCVAGIQN